MKKKNKFIIVRIEDNLKNRYCELCESMGLTLSKRIILIIEKDIKLLEKMKNDYE